VTWCLPREEDYSRAAEKGNSRKPIYENPNKNLLWPGPNDLKGPVEPRSQPQHIVGMDNYR
jgi:hypothetical protein